MRIYLRARSTKLTSEEIARALGIAPTSARRTHEGVTITCFEPYIADSAIKTRLASFAHFIAGLAAPVAAFDASCTFTVVMTNTAQDGDLGIHFRPDQLETFAKFRAGIDLDLYAGMAVSRQAAQHGLGTLERVWFRRRDDPSAAIEGVVFAKSPMRSPTRDVPEWQYSIFFPTKGVYRNVSANALTGTGEYADGQQFLGAKDEFSLDTEVGSDMPIVEGCYRLVGHNWATFSVLRDEDSTRQPEYGTWGNGVTWVSLYITGAEEVTANAVERWLSAALGISALERVPGPDSLMVRPD